MCDSPELLHALERLEKVIKREDKPAYVDQTYQVSDTQGFTLDYQGYRFLFVYSGTPLFFLLGETTYPIPENIWTPLQFKQGFKVFTSGTSSPVGIRVRATDDLLATLAVSNASAGASATFHAITTASTNAATVKSTPGLVYGVQLSNESASDAFLKFYDETALPTVGTDTVKKTIRVPSSGTVIAAWPNGLLFKNGIGIGCSGGIADNDNTNTAATISIDIDFQK